MVKKRVYFCARIAKEFVDGWLYKHALLTRDDTIEAVIPQSNIPTDIAQTHYTYNLGDVSMLPGLIEAHCHMHCSGTYDNLHLAMTENYSQLLIRAVNNMRNCLFSGVTTVRDLGSRNDVAFTIRNAINSGLMYGPRLLLAGAPITITGGHCWFFATEADTDEQVITAVRKQIRMGADIIKIMGTGGLFTPTSNPRQVQYSRDTLSKAVNEVQRMGSQIAVHVLSAEGIKNCVTAGVDHIIHARWLDFDVSKGLNYDEDIAREIADKGIWVDPTIAHIMLTEEMAAKGEIPPQKPHRSLGYSVPSPEDHLALLKRMDEGSVRFTAGLDMGMLGAKHSDSACNAWALHEQLGWDTWRAIRCATLDNANALRVSDSVGSLRPGLKADIAIFNGDPAHNIRELKSASSVIKDGIPVKINGLVQNLM